MSFRGERSVRCLWCRGRRPGCSRVEQPFDPAPCSGVVEDDEDREGDGNVVVAGNGEAVRQLVLGGLGIARCSDFIVSDDIAASGKISFILFIRLRYHSLS